MAADIFAAITLALFFCMKMECHTDRLYGAEFLIDLFFEAYSQR